jgi:hypothetical protein
MSQNTVLRRARALRVDAQATCYQLFIIFINSIRAVSSSLNFDDNHTLGQGNKVVLIE